MSRLTQDVSEQMGVMDVLASMPETGQEVTGMVGSSTSPCEVSKTSSEMVLELFGKARGLSGQPSQTDSKVQNWVTRISKSVISCSSRLRCQLGKPKVCQHQFPLAHLSLNYEL